MKGSKQGDRKTNWVYIVTTVVVALVSFITGIGNLVPFPHIESDLIHLGYPPYFRFVLGTWKVLAAVALAVPGNYLLKNLAYMGILFDLTGAAASRVAVGDGAFKVVVPLIISIWVLVSWWNYRNRVAAASQRLS
jgi:hypothetical protein